MTAKEDGSMFHSGRLTLVTLAMLLSTAGVVLAQEMPSDYRDVLKTLDRKGDFKAGVLKVNIPRVDLKMTIQGVPTPTPFGFGGWVSLTKASDGMDAMMGDLVLLQDEVNPVMSALLEHGIEVTALHNHFFWDEPRVFYMHVHGMGRASELARSLKRSEEHTSELQSLRHLVCRLLLEKKKQRCKTRHQTECTAKTTTSLR